MPRALLGTSRRSPVNLSWVTMCGGGGGAGHSGARHREGGRLNELMDGQLRQRRVSRFFPLLPVGMLRVRAKGRMRERGDSLQWRERWHGAGMQRPPRDPKEPAWLMNVVDMPNHHALSNYQSAQPRSHTHTARLWLRRTPARS